MKKAVEREIRWWLQGYAEENEDIENWWDDEEDWGNGHDETDDGSLWPEPDWIPEPDENGKEEFA